MKRMHKSLRDKSKGKIWHSVMCVLRHRERGGDTQEGREKRWTDVRIEGDGEGKLERGEGKWG